MPTTETVGIISDTHLSRCTPEFLAICQTHFVGCRRLLHAGDLTRPAVLDGLSAHFEVLAVRGNMDVSQEMASLPLRRVVQIGGLSVGLRHGGGSSMGLEARILDEFGDSPPDLIVYGHTHRAADQQIGGVRFLNPGSPTDSRGEPYCSIGRLTVTGTDARFDIIRL